MKRKSLQRPNPHPGNNYARDSQETHPALELQRGQKLKNPRLYSVEIKLSSTKTVSKMLGVAFTSAQRQKYYSEFKVYKYWGNYWHYRVTFHIEPIGKSL